MSAQARIGRHAMAAIDDIPGISAGDRDGLAALGLHTTDDLLRTERNALMRRMPGLTREGILRWQAIAELVQIDGLSASDAGMLADAGVNGVDELRTWLPSRVLAAVPRIDSDTAAGWSIDAMRLSQTGVVNGNVRLRDSTPVEGAAVSIAGQTLLTDQRGRFRAVRLALGTKLTVEVHHPELGFTRVRNVVPHRSGALVATDVVLAGRPQMAKDLSELRGDTLPPLTSAPMTTRQVTDAPDARDVLVFVRTYANGDYQVASRFLDFSGGRFVRRTYRLPASVVTLVPRRGDDLVADGTRWRVTRLNRGQLGRRVAQFAVQRRFPSIPSTAAGQDAMAKAIARSLEARR
ncbi:DUF4332 domain-containing protein [Microbacterium sp. NPDC057650]|uniref:DUF4332 domain-containing protein n=1 Tax=unclassified Microbacterium TaxID=2609290 RepID=UPI00366BCF90